MKGKLSTEASRLRRERDGETGRMGRRHGSEDHGGTPRRGCLAAPCGCTHANGARGSARSQDLGQGYPPGRPEGLPSPTQAGAQRDECIPLPTRLCPAPLSHLKRAAKAGEGKEEVPPLDTASIETSGK